MTLKDLQIGQSARILTVGGAGALRKHFLDMGMIPGAEVTLMKLAPLGDPMELRIRGYELTLRVDDAKKIGIEPLSELEALANLTVADLQAQLARINVEACSLSVVNPL